jgi:hypothetical protein
MAMTAEDEFAAALAALVRMAERVGLDREANCLKSIQTARSLDVIGRLSYMESSCADVIGEECLSKMAKDPDFPPQNWKDRKARSDEEFD